MNVMYSCNACGTSCRSVKVPQREFGEDITEWMDRVRMVVTFDHSMYAPHCKSQQCDLKIPLPDDPDGFIGRLP